MIISLRGCAKFPADVKTETYWILKQEAEVLQEVMRMMNSLKQQAGGTSSSCAAALELAKSFTKSRSQRMN